MSSMQDQLPKQLSSSADEVEALARVLRAQYCGEDRWDGEILNANKEDWLRVARAAIAHMRKRPEGRVMVKCPYCHAQLGSCKYCHNCNEHNSRLITGPAPKEEKMVTVIVGDSMFHEGDWRARQEQDPFRATLRDQIDDNTNAAAVNALLIKLQNVTAERDRLVDENKQVTIDYGIAVKSHNRQQEAHVACKNEVDRLVSQLAAVTAERDAIRERAAVPVPAGVPSVRDLREIGVHAYLSHDSAKRENAGCMVGPMGAAADAILTALAPYLRDPVGWKLDVTAEELSDILLPAHRQSVTVMQATRTILDLCRSRIRPTFECKECAARESGPTSFTVKWNREIGRWEWYADNTVRAALEGAGGDA